MPPRLVLRVALPALAGTAIWAAPAVADPTVLPTPDDARTFATTNGGWTSAVDYGGNSCIVGVTCPTANPSYRSTGGAAGAADGHLRNTFGTLLGVLSTTTISWTSPSFEAPSGVDVADLTFKIRPQIASLLAIGSVKLTPRLVDVANPASSIVLAARPLTAASASFGPQTFSLPAADIVPGRTYRVQISVSHTTNVSAVTSGNVDIDDVALTLDSLAGPRDLTASVPATGPVRVTGSVDAHGFDTDVTVEYGTTTSYGSTTTPKTLPGSTSGAQDFSVPLTGLQPGETYHYRVKAENAERPVTTADATFVAPSPPSSAVPAVTGAATSRIRTVTFARAADVTDAAVELVATDGTIVQTWTDTDASGSETITLPDADGTYDLRVRRKTNRDLVSTSATVPVTLDRVGPDVSGVALSVTPAASPSRDRAVSIVRPSDAVTVTAQVLDADDATVGAAVTVPAGTAAVQLGAADGTYRVRLTLADAAGNTTDVTSTALVLDTQAPAAGPAPTVTGAGNARKRTVEFVRDPSADTVEVEILGAGGAVVDTVPVTSGDHVDVTLPDVDGSYGVRARQSDAAGNDARTSVTALVLDRVAPDAGPAPSAPAAADDTGAVSLAFVRAPDAVDVVVEVRDASGTVVRTVPVPSGDRASVVLPAAAGRYTLRVVQTDAAGNRNVSAETTVERRAAPAPETPAAPTAATPVPPAACRRPATALTIVSRSGTQVAVRGFTSSAAGTTVVIVDGANQPVGTAVVGADGSFSATVAPTKNLRRGHIRYRILDGGRSSSAAQLDRANRLGTVRRTGDTVTLTGRVDLKRVGRVRTITALGGAGACPDPVGTFAPVGRFKVDAQGRYRLTVRAEAAGRLVIRTRVQGTRAPARSVYVVR